MSALTMSNEAYIEFKTYLTYNKIENFNIRITLAGVAEEAQFLILFWMNKSKMMRLS